jgi:hypothetical protein
MKLLHIFQFWTDLFENPFLCLSKRFWFYREKTPKGFRLITICGIAMVFDRPEISI